MKQLTSPPLCGASRRRSCPGPRVPPLFKGPKPSQFWESRQIKFPDGDPLACNLMSYIFHLMYRKKVGAGMARNDNFPQTTVAAGGLKQSLSSEDQAAPHNPFSHVVAAAIHTYQS